MPNKVRFHKFIGRPEPDIVIGERVVMKTPLANYRARDIRESVTLHEFNKWVERQCMDIYKRFGADCADFELVLDKGYPVAISFTRPMDAIELIEIRKERQRIEDNRNQQIEREIDSNAVVPSQTPRLGQERESDYAQLEPAVEHAGSHRPAYRSGGHRDA